MGKTPKVDPSTETAEISVLEVRRGAIDVYVVGTTPLIPHAMSAKVKMSLLVPPKKKNKTERETTMKHNPMEEYRDCFNMARRPDVPTAILGPSTWFKGAMMTAALDLPGMFKSQIGRLVWVHGDYSSDMIHIYGVPQLFMSVVRQAGMTKTPDIRTRPIIPRWCAKVTVGYGVPLIRQADVANLLAAAGITCGVGDWRPQKGSGTFGQYRLAASDDPEAQDIMAQGGRAAQLAAIDAPEWYNEETADLMAWFEKVKKNHETKAT